MTDPPLLDGGVHVTVAPPALAVAVAPVGTPETVYGIATFDWLETGELPAAFVAMTLKTYSSPGVSPEATVHVVVVELQVCPPLAGVVRSTNVAT